MVASFWLVVKLNLTNHYKRSIVHIREHVKKKIHKCEYFLKKVMPSNERLESVINKHAKNLSDFALKYGYTKSTLHNYLKGRDLDSKFIISLKDKLNVNPTWLLTGEGGMFLSDTSSNKTTVESFRVGNADNTVEVTFDENGYPITKIYQPSESKKSKTKSADVVSLEGLSDSEKEHVINTVKLFLAGKGKK